jgi:maltose O-acetyltransferase
MGCSSAAPSGVVPTIAAFGETSRVAVFCISDLGLTLSLLSPFNRVVGRLLRTLHVRVITPARLIYRKKVFGTLYALDIVGRLPMEEIPDALRWFGATIGDRPFIKPGIRFENVPDDLSQLTIGDNVHIGSEVFIDLTGPVTIGDDVALAARVCIVTHLSAGDRPLSAVYESEVKGVKIDDGALIGTAAVILHGVTIEERVVIAAQSLVTRDVPAGVVAGGVPARPLRMLAEVPA